MIDEIRTLNNKEILLELKEWYSSKELAKLLDITEATISNFLNDKSAFALKNTSKLKSFFTKHVQENAQFEQIKNIFNDWEENGTNYMVDTPDGFQYASRFITKDSRPCYDLRAVNFHIECSGDHLCETDSGWVNTSEIKKGDRVLTKVGFEEVQSNEQIEDSEVYDMTIEHVNHRYWGGAGISSHNSGKSFLTARAIVDAQRDGYWVVVIDSEQAVSQDYLEGIGVQLNPNKLTTLQATTVEEAQDIMIEFLDGVRDAQADLEDKSDLKFMLIVDSLGLLASTKAIENAEANHHAADMGTKAKALTKMFTAVTQKIGKTDAVCLMTNHGAMEIGCMFPQLKPKGGQCLVAGTMIQTENGMKPIESITTSDKVKTHMNRFKPVVKLFSFDDLEVLEVELDNGQTIKMTPEHKMLVERDNEHLWITAKDLTTTDSFLMLGEVAQASLKDSKTTEREMA